MAFDILKIEKKGNRVPAPDMASRAALVASAPGGRSDKRRDRTHPTRGLPPIPRTVPTQKPLPNACAQPCSLLAQVISRLFFDITIFCKLLSVSPHGAHALRAEELQRRFAHRRAQQYACRECGKPPAVMPPDPHCPCLL